MAQTLPTGPVPTPDPSGEPFRGVPQVLPGTMDVEVEIVNTLNGYKNEAKEARRSGMNPRDEKWSSNLNLYWNRYDFSNKAAWQAKEVMPEVPAYVDRFAAALKEALVQTPEGFYTVDDPADREHDVSDAIKKMTDAWLSTIGRNQMGQPQGFASVFEEQMKLGALMACSGVVTWKNDVPRGRVAFETVDPQMVWLDHTYRNLYRIRTIELDRHDLVRMSKATTSKGKPVFNLPALEALQRQLLVDEYQRRAQLVGHGLEITSNRVPIILDEYVATVLAPDGTVLADKAMMVVANDRFLIRGPEANPFWHERDWLVYTPLVTAPLSVYGRSYMEDFGSLATVYTSLTNLILDAAQTSALNAYALVPSMLLNPEQAVSGLSPNKVFLLDEGYDARQFAQELNLGTLDGGAVQVWEKIKAGLSEAAGINEIGMGQFAPKGRTSATEIAETTQSSSAIVRSVAQTIETRFLDVLLDLVWKTGLQHAKADDPVLSAAVGPELYSVLMQPNLRRDLIKRPITFQARGISALIQKNQMMTALTQFMQVIAQNENLLAAFMQVIDMNKFLRLIFRLTNVDFSELAATPRQRLMSDTMSQLSQAAQGGQPTEPGLDAMAGVAGLLGIGAQ